MKKFPELTTSRLILRKIKLSHLPSLIKYISNKKIADNLINIPFPFSEEDAIFRLNFILEGFKNEERYVFTITEKDQKELIGQMGLHLDKANNKAEIGYWIGEPFWNKGIATEALAAILKFGFEELNLNKIYATHYIDNPSSGKVLIKNKMIKEGELKDNYKTKDGYGSVIQYRLTKKEYAALPI